MARAVNPENGATSSTGQDISLGVAFVSSFTSPTENTALSGHFFVSQPSSYPPCARACAS